MRLQPCANALRVETVPAFRQLPVAVAAASADVVKAYGAVHRLQSGVGWLAADSGVEFLQQGQRVDELKLIIHFMFLHVVGNSVRLLCAEEFKGKVSAVEILIKVHKGSRLRLRGL